MSAPPSRSGDAGAPPRPPWVLIGAVCALTALRLLLAAEIPLTEDEAYYRLWAQAPAFGYFDHPPMVAWAIWLGVQLLGDNPLGLRLAAIAAGVASSALVYDATRLAGGAQEDAARAGLWYNATLLVAAGAFLSVPDVFAALFWVAAVDACLRAWRSGAAGWWLAAGAAAGLASLSKYSALFLGPGVFLWLCCTPAGRLRLRTPGPWLALGVAAALFGVNVAWNATHHWLTFAKQFGRIAPKAFAPRYLVEFLATEAVLLNPLVAVFAVRGALSKQASPGLGALPFIATSAPFVGYLILHSLHDRIQAHWPAPVYPALAIIAALGAREASGRWAAIRTLVPGLGFGLCAAAGAYAALPLVGVPLKADPAHSIRDWPAFSRSVDTLARRNGAAWIGTTSYGLAAQFLSEREISLPVLQLSERARWVGLSPGLAVDTRRPGIVIDLQRRVDPKLLAGCFATARPIGLLVRAAPGEKGKTYAVWRVTGPLRDLIRSGCAGEAPAEP